MRNVWTWAFTNHLYSTCMFERRCHPAVTKRPWQQVKVKYKNVLNYRNPLNNGKAKSLAIPLQPALWISVNRELSLNLCFLDMFKMTWIIANRKKGCGLQNRWRSNTTTTHTGWRHGPQSERWPACCWGRPWGVDSSSVPVTPGPSSD